MKINNKINARKIINKLFLMFLFYLSFLKFEILAIWTMGVFLYYIYREKKIGALKFFILIQLRSLINPGIAVGYGDTKILGALKWCTILSASIFLLIGLSDDEKAKLRKINYLIVLFAVSSIISAFMTSSYPIGATFKIIAFAIPFLAIINVVNSCNNINWMALINEYLGLLVIGSLIFINSPTGYLRNGIAFQGFFNHPNVYGVMIVLYLAGILYYNKKINLKVITIIFLSIFLVLKTLSRTSLISAFIIIIIYLIKQKMKMGNKLFIIILLSLLLITFFMVDNQIKTELITFMNKGNENNILFSRESQFKNNIIRFWKSPILGTGFNVPYVENFVSYKFSFDLVVENGNLILSLLGDVGIIGFIIFFYTYFSIYKIGKNDITTIFFAPFLVSMGEMAFFSTNNFAIILYFYFAIYISNGFIEKGAKDENIVYNDNTITI